MFNRGIGGRLSTRSLAIERLERKNLLAGDVTAVVTDGDLRITGDSNDNHVQIVGTADPGEYRILGVDRSGAPTTINGQSGQIRVTGVVDDIVIDMQGGDSRVALLNGEFGTGGDQLELVVPDDLIVFNRAGRLEVRAANVRVDDDFIINTRDGADEIALLETLVGDELRIESHGGADEVGTGPSN